MMTSEDPSGSPMNSKSSSSSCNSDEVGSEERLKKLFQACDRDGDGYIDSEDVFHMCQLLNMEEAVNDLLEQLEVNRFGRISFAHFIRCRARLLAESEQDPLFDRACFVDDGIARAGDSRTSGSHLHPGTDSVEFGGCEISQPSLLSLMQHQQPHLYQQLLGLAENIQRQGGSNLLEVIHSLEVTGMNAVNRRMTSIIADRDFLQKQVNKYEFERMKGKRDMESRLEQQCLAYEERIIELHSVIAELRKKIEKNTISVIREEDEETASNKSNDGLSANENYGNISTALSFDLGNELNAELTQAVLQSQITDGKTSQPPNDRVTQTAEGKEQQVVEHEEAEAGVLSTPIMPPGGSNMTHKDKLLMQDHHDDQESQLEMMRTELNTMAEERDRLKSKVHELQSHIEKLTPGPISPCSTQSRGKTKVISPQSSPLTDTEPQGPVARVAELKKLKTGRTHVLGAEIAYDDVSSAKMAEHLSQSMQECSDVQEIINSICIQDNKAAKGISENKIEEFEMEIERLQSKIDNFKAQNDLLNLTLEESKSHCDRLTVLIGKHESNTTALQLAAGYSDQIVDAYSTLVALLDTDLNALLAKYTASGLTSSRESDLSRSHGDISALLHNTHTARRTAEQAAKRVLLTLDSAMVGHQQVTGFPTSPPWEDLSSNHTTSTCSSTASSAEADFTKLDEQRLREHVRQLRADRAAVKVTVMELESVHIDPLGYDAAPSNPEVRRLDLENAVLMQELMAIKEEKAEYKTKNYLMEKERAALQLQLCGKESQEKAYRMQIDHLKSEIHDTQPHGPKDPKRDDGYDSATPAITLAELRSHDSSQMARDLSESLRREKMLKKRVQDLVVTLEKLSKNSEVRHQQSAEFVNDLKKANSALVSAFEKAKKKYVSRIKRMESQLETVTQRYETQLRAMKQRISLLEDESARLQKKVSETSL